MLHRSQKRPRRGSAGEMRVTNCWQPTEDTHRASAPPPNNPVAYGIEHTFRLHTADLATLGTGLERAGPGVDRSGVTSRGGRHPGSSARDSGDRQRTFSRQRCVLTPDGHELAVNCRRTAGAADQRAAEAEGEKEKGAPEFHHAGSITRKGRTDSRRFVPIRTRCRELRPFFIRLSLSILHAAVPACWRRYRA